MNITTDKYRRCDISVGISYNSDIGVAREALMKLLAGDEAVLKDREMLVFRIRISTPPARLDRLPCTARPIATPAEPSSREP